MRVSEFWRLATEEFGDTTARVIVDSLILPSLHVTAQQALDRGVEPKRVWHDLCDLHQIPESRRLGRDIPTKDNPDVI
ncbi:MULTISPECIES: DUF3046 domain-containing protein [Auritidibacter]|uniref:DUF3046 domain-containing protein n=1 Tax=Auritidibacter ignavus TaxID=678932 RepID=A0AAJ6AIU6_9MICC|nr:MULTISPECIES: DUF3046 domain-containing protein [Auritidibacter]PXA81185.1 DUF3046 domain-containing protein [Auritidibacter sp. NML120779]AXR73788.1 DUF3046 domain-containing protein [Auritidibacter sp. NML130574]NIH72304.1 hypothetical protein [Auritidibacter ignavus]PXA76081.1 DUF3046 domain-containing protein [Auritidibacter sp. NML100628]PXA78755.1 DUF3046 domain-containing protein [Auritidibacter sp. NML120636]